MRNIRQLLVATDFSEHAERAETRAAMLCAELQCERLELLTVNDPSLLDALASVLDRSRGNAEILLEQQLERRLQAMSQELAERYGIRCAHGLRLGRPASEILARADELPADLTVVGAHGGNFFTDLLLGNNADKLVRLGKRPLLIVRNVPERSYEKVLVPVDFSEDALQAARMALEVAPTAHITFLHVFHVPYEGQMRQAGVAEDVINQYRVQTAESARRELNRFIEELGPRSQLLSRSVQFGIPALSIYAYAEQAKPDLIAMGKHGRSRFEELLLGSVTRRIIDHTACDVLVTTALKGSGEWYERTAA